MALEKELQTFNRLFSSAVENEGKFAVIHGEDLLGTFTSYEDALAMGYRAYGLKPFLVKLVSSAPEFANYTRRMAFA